MTANNDSFQAVLDQKMKQNQLKTDDSMVRKHHLRTTLIGGQFHPAISKQLGIMAVEEEKTKRELLEEALDLLFVDRNKPRVQDLI